MKKETKNEAKSNLANGVSAAAGAAVGVVIGAAITPEDALADEIEVTAVEQPATPPTDVKPAANNEELTAVSETQNNAETPVTPVEEQPVRHDVPADNPEHNGSSDEIEVLGYDRLTNQEGNQIDLAVINVHGNEVGVVDADMDGIADAVMHDANGNGVIEENEIHPIVDEVIPMQPLADAAGFNPLYAQNDLPDYVNDAQVDTFNV